MVAYTLAMRDMGGRIWYVSRSAGIYSFQRTEDPYMAKVFATREDARDWAIGLPGSWKRLVVGGRLEMVALEIESVLTGDVFDLGPTSVFDEPTRPVRSKKEHDLVRRYAAELEAREAEHEGID